MMTQHASRHARLPDWAARLDALVAERLALPFAWGPNDCAVWAADAYLAETGRDGLQELRAPRTSRQSALRQLARHGGLPAILARAGLPVCAPMMARRGDLVLIEQAGWGVLALCNGADALAPGMAGLEATGMGRAVGAWRV